jgi:hypothetical protein
MLARAHASMLAVTLGLAPLAALGCAGDAAEEEEIAAIQAALELEDGGMTEEAEAPAFADPAVRLSPALVTTYADTLAVEPAQQPSAASWHVMVIWGHLPPAHDRDDTVVTPAPVDWTGQVSVDAGAIGVERSLVFEPGDGVAPRTDPAVVAFASRTLPHVDGLLLKVVIPEGGAPVLHFQTSALTADIDLSQLAAKAGGGVPVGDGRNGMAFLGFQDEPGVAKGFVVGHWGKLDAEVGRLRGRVVGADGGELGHLRGIWGHAPNKDEDLFFGKYIAGDGAYRGIFGGTYGDGAFHGRWGNEQSRDAGVIEGRYSDGYAKGDHRGAFLGRWSEKVAE